MKRINKSSTPLISSRIIDGITAHGCPVPGDMATNDRDPGSANVLESQQDGHICLLALVTVVEGWQDDVGHVALGKTHQ